MGFLFDAVIKIEDDENPIISLTRSNAEHMSKTPFTNESFSTGIYENKLCNRMVYKDDDDDQVISATSAISLPSSSCVFDDDEVYENDDDDIENKCEKEILSKLPTSKISKSEEIFDCFDFECP